MFYGGPSVGLPVHDHVLKKLQTACRNSPNSQLSCTWDKDERVIFWDQKFSKFKVTVQFSSEGIPMDGSPWKAV